MEFTIGMSLVDFIPVICFAIAAVLLQKDLFTKMDKGSYALMACGQIDIVCAGGLKALYKLLYAAGICDFALLNTLFFPLQALGFFFAGIGVLGFVVYREKKLNGTLPKKSKDMKLKSSLGAGILLTTTTVLLTKAGEPPYFSGTMLFVAMMVIGDGLICFCLAYYARVLKKPLAIVLFVISFLFSMGMGYLSSRDFSTAYMNWIAEFVNIIGQGSLLWGTCILHKENKK